MTQPPRDADWLLGLAKLRAKQIERVVRAFACGEIAPQAMIDTVIAEARAILNDEEPKP